MHLLLLHAVGVFLTWLAVAAGLLAIGVSLLILSLIAFYVIGLVRDAQKAPPS